VKPPGLLRASGKPLVEPAHGLRRHGRAGAGADDLARRRGAAIPQTATSTKWSGLEVNLRGIVFTRTSRSPPKPSRAKPVLREIEGAIVGEARKPVDSAGGSPSACATRRAPRSMPGTRYWSCRLLKPGERAWFKSRLLRRRRKGAISISLLQQADIAAAII